jgi:hypothetical protein
MLPLKEEVRGLRAQQKPLHLASQRERGQRWKLVAAGGFEPPSSRL